LGKSTWLIDRKSGWPAGGSSPRNEMDSNRVQTILMEKFAHGRIGPFRPHQLNCEPAHFFVGCE
jgi:hypothetical protein